MNEADVIRLREFRQLKVRDPGIEGIFDRWDRRGQGKAPGFFWYGQREDADSATVL